MKKAKGKRSKGRGRRVPDTPQAAARPSVNWVHTAQISVPEPKEAISFRVDPDVLDFFREQGPRYQTRMNAVLRAYMTAHSGEENK
ncbi:MAG TPA: BrnA antitoxin family protein [Gemmatimonadales bacterium]|nr:BrnA antitoxin family protein [Gemmatimonadales bacterium]